MNLCRLSVTIRPLRYVRYNSVISRHLRDKAALKTKKKPVSPNFHSLRRLNQNDATSTESVILLLLEQYNHVTVTLSELPRYLHPVTSITVGESIDLDKAASILALNGLHHRVLIADEVLGWRVGGENGLDVMILANGTLVGWGMTETQMMKAYVPTVMGAVCERYEPESEEMDFVNIDVGASEDIRASFMQGDVLVLQGKQRQEQRLLEMAAFAIGLSRSTRLLILEESLEKHISLTRENSVALLKGLRVETKEEDIVRLTGRLFLIRGKLNLYSELIETPDLYWSEPTLEKIYDSVSRQLDILLRISIMNRKLDYMTEEQRALLSVLNEKKSTRLEWIIIILIMVEVCFETFHFVEKWESRGDERSD